MSNWSGVLLGGLGVLLVGVGVYVWSSHTEHHAHFGTGLSGEALAPMEEHLDRIILRVRAEENIPVADTTPAAPDGPHSQWFYSEPVSFATDKRIVGMEARILDADTDVLHHLAVGLVNRPATLCTMHFAQSSGMHELYITSRQALDPVELPAPYALLVRAGEAIGVEFMTHAQAAPHGGHGAHEALQPTLEITLFTDDTRTHEAHFVRLRLDDTPCEDPLAHQAFVVPAETEAFTKRSSVAEIGGSARYELRQSGQILAAGANFWPRKGGESVTGYLNDVPFHTFTAEPGAESWQHNIPHLTNLISFAAGDVLTLSSVYRNPGPTPVLDAAGMLSVYYTFDQLIAQTDTATEPEESE